LTNLVAAYVPSLILPEGGYVRTFEAEIDAHSECAIRVSGVLSDHRCALEHEWVLQTPEYEVMQASARHLHGEPGILSPELIVRYPDIRGVRIAAGFTRTIRQALGELPGYQEHLALAIEMARVGQQAYQLPKGYYEQFWPLTVDIPSEPSRLARMAWEQDRSYRPDLCNSCYAFRDASVTLFNERTVVSYNPDIMSPDPGQKCIFWRTKRMHITQHPDGLGFHCQNEMDDTVHEIRLAFDMDAGGTVQQAQSQAIRAPYMGICEEAQLKTLGLNGKMFTKEFIRLIADQVGGSSGCTHLFDLSVDCLRFFTWR
jgi:hypothetical protein